MNVLALAPEHDTEGKKDASCAFQPECKAFAKLHGGRWDLINNAQSYAARRAQTIRIVSEHVHTHGPLDVFAACCHGWPTGIQFGFRSDHTTLLARTLVQSRAAGGPVLTVALYACDTGRDADDDRADDQDSGPGGEGGFADLLCTALGNLGHRARVYGHTTLGHTTSNPYLRVFSTDDNVRGGLWIIAPKSPQWARWARAMRETDLRLRVPFMSLSQILAELDPKVA